MSTISPQAIRRSIIEVAHRSGHGHIPSCFSVTEILSVLYSGFLRVHPQNPEAEDRDHFIFSKGHAAAAMFSVLGEAGFFPLSSLHDTYGKTGSLFGCHPDRNKVPGIEASTGSLGHGLPFSVGVAMGLKIKKRSNRVVCLIGDGEANEGTVWESSMVASHQKLENLIGILDLNQSTVRCLPVSEPAAKWAAFGWNVAECDGHDTEAILKTLVSFTALANGKPSMLVAHTIKGKGVSFTEKEQFSWHHRAPTADEYKAMLAEVL